ncbi:MAG TPA: metallophosphoesterase family protein [Candidatus Binatia bacterium]|nr:metallophosphoesterase family protein [Candidatus Binatia bacterium]
MRIAIISDVHANLAALEVIQESSDFLLCLGDLVDYGPWPREAVQWVRERAFTVIRGNHDQALAYDIDCGCARVMKEASITTRAWHTQILSAEDKHYLHELPLRARLELGGATFFLAHASPTGDLYKYLRPELSDEALAEEIRGIDADFICIGHTHLPMLRHLDKSTIVNPGSVGQPRHGDPRASYVVWEDGEIQFRHLPYDTDKAIAALAQSPIPDSVLIQLSRILHTGGAKGY